jgi:dTDP-4-dehydrorhamnose reductase
MDSLRVVITGGSGYLGGRLLRGMAGQADVVGTFSSQRRLADFPLIQLDVTDSRAVYQLFEEGKFHTCVHAAGNCNLDWCETHVDQAYTLNVIGTRNVAEACKAFGVRLIFISTDHVFDGKPSTSFTEADCPRPLQYYGTTKFSAEQEVSSVPGSLSLRLPLLYGEPRAGEKESFLGHVVRILSQANQFPADNSAVRYPVLINDAIETICSLVKIPVEGLLHYSSDEGVTKYAWAKMIAGVFGFDPTMVVPGPDVSAALRPQNNRLGSIRLDSLPLTPPRSVTQATQELRKRML